MWLGAALIIVGLAFFLQNAFGAPFDDWWALLFLIPAAGSLQSALWHYRRGDTASASGSFAIGLVFAFLTAVFLLQLDWSKLWPIFLILFGIGMLLPALRRGSG